MNNESLSDQSVITVSDTIDNARTLDTPACGTKWGVSAHAFSAGRAVSNWPAPPVRHAVNRVGYWTVDAIMLYATPAREKNHARRGSECGCAVGKYHIVHDADAPFLVDPGHTIRGVARTGAMVRPALWRDDRRGLAGILFWTLRLLVMLEDDAAMWAFMFS